MDVNPHSIVFSLYYEFVRLYVSHKRLVHFALNRPKMYEYGELMISVSSVFGAIEFWRDFSFSMASNK